MMKNDILQEDFRDFIWKRCDSSHSLVVNDPLHRKTHQEFSKAYEKLYKIVGEEGQALLRTIESSLNLLGALEMEAAYKMGLKDGIQLKQELDLVS